MKLYNISYSENINDIYWETVPMPLYKEISIDSETDLTIKSIPAPNQKRNINFNHKYILQQINTYGFFSYNDINYKVCIILNINYNEFIISKRIRDIRMHIVKEIRNKTINNIINETI